MYTQSLSFLEIGLNKLNQCDTCITQQRILVREKWDRGEPFTIIIQELEPLTRDVKEQQCNGCYTVLDKEGLRIDFEEYFPEWYFV